MVRDCAGGFVPPKWRWIGVNAPPGRTRRDFKSFRLKVESNQVIDTKPRRDKCSNWDTLYHQFYLDILKRSHHWFELCVLAGYRWVIRLELGKISKFFPVIYWEFFKFLKCFWMPLKTSEEEEEEETWRGGGGGWDLRWSCSFSKTGLHLIVKEQRTALKASSQWKRFFFFLPDSQLVLAGVQSNNEVHFGLGWMMMMHVKYDPLH